MGDSIRCRPKGQTSWRRSTRRPHDATKLMELRPTRGSCFGQSARSCKTLVPRIRHSYQNLIVSTRLAAKAKSVQRREDHVGADSSKRFVSRGLGIGSTMLCRGCGARGTDAFRLCLVHELEDAVDGRPV